MEPLKKVIVEVELDAAQLERLVVVGGDLEYLRDLPADRLPTHAEVRLIAGVLRRLFVDKGNGEVGKVVQAIPLKPRLHLAIECVDLDAALGKWTSEWIWYAWSGGAEFPGAHHRGFIVADVPKAVHEAYGSPEEFFRQNPVPVVGDRRIFTVDDWLKSTAMAVRTNEQGLVRISRSSVLKYIANRKGGVHFDTRRRLDARKPQVRALEHHFHLLDHGLVRVGHLSGPEYEVVSMARDVVTTDWARQFMELGREHAPEDYDGDPAELRFWSGQKEEDGTGWATSRFGPAEGEAGE